jgi:LPS export ABC transporter protein LptC
MLAVLTVMFVVRVSTGLKTKQAMGGRISPPSGQASASIDHFSYVQEKSGGIAWQVNAKRAEIYDADHQAKLSDVRVRIDNPKGVGLSLVGDEGILDTISKNVEIRQNRGNLRLLFDNGYVAETSRLAWNQGAKEISSPDPVRIHGPNIDIQGIGFVMSATSRSVRVLKDVRVAITP